MLAFRPLTPSARSGNLIAGDGTKNGLFRSEQRTVSKTQTTISDQTANREGKALDRKSPIQVRCEPQSAPCHRPNLRRNAPALHPTLADHGSRGRDRSRG